MAEETLTCPREHPGSAIVRDGIQRRGGRERQRWRCTPVDGVYHRFLGTLSRTRATDETCVECENHIAPHQGPAAPASFEYLVREIAGALVDVGRGSTYKDSARRARARANIGKPGHWREVVNGQTVAEWMADFATIVSARHKPTEWPAILVLDSVQFRWTDPQTKMSMGLYSILAAYGYDKDGKNGRLWKLEASPTSTSIAWENFLATLPGEPESIVCDSDYAIRGGVDRHWGQHAAVNLIHLCEHHLRMNATEAMRGDAVPPEDEIRRMLRTAFTAAEHWEPFVAEIRRRPQLQLTNKWLKRIETLVGTQVRVRHQTPPIYSNGALEAVLVDIRQMLAPRAFAFRNRARLNYLLELIRLSQLRVDNVTDYAADIRAHLLESTSQFTRTYREVYDPAPKSKADQLCSLWAKPAQEAMQAARSQRKSKV